MEALGIDLRWFLFQLGNFIVLFALLYFILHKPIRALLENRNREIREGLENAEKMKAALAEAEQRQLEIIEQAQKDARSLLEEVKMEARALEGKLSEEAQAKAERMLKKAQEDIASERDQLRSELRGELASMVIQATEKVIDTTITGSEKKEQVEKLVKELEK